MLRGDPRWPVTIACRKEKWAQHDGTAREIIFPPRGISNCARRLTSHIQITSLRLHAIGRSLSRSFPRILLDGSDVCAQRPWPVHAETCAFCCCAHVCVHPGHRVAQRSIRLCYSIVSARVPTFKHNCRCTATDPHILILHAQDYLSVQRRTSWNVPQ